MRLLLDTRTMLWAVASPERLTGDASTAIRDHRNEVLVSVASAWEIGMKQQAGLVTLPAPAKKWLPAAVAEATMTWLPIGVEHAALAATLPDHHPDQFARMIAAQAQYEGATLVTSDPRFEHYGLRLMMT